MNYFLFTFTSIDNSAWITYVLFRCSVVSNSFQLHGLRYTQLPGSPPSPRACSNSLQLSWWCHSAISSSVVPFSSCLQSSTASGVFPVSELFTSGSQSIGTSASALVPVNIQGWFPLDLISFQSTGLSRVFCSTTVWKHLFFATQPSLWSNSHTCILILHASVSLFLWYEMP